jgi:hypothetical protein
VDSSRARGVKASVKGRERGGRGGEEEGEARGKVAVCH